MDQSTTYLERDTLYDWASLLWGRFLRGRRGFAGCLYRETGLGCNSFGVPPIISIWGAVVSVGSHGEMTCYADSKD